MVGKVGPRHHHPGRHPDHPDHHPGTTATHGPGCPQMPLPGARDGVGGGGGMAYRLEPPGAAWSGLERGQ